VDALYLIWKEVGLLHDKINSVYSNGSDENDINENKEFLHESQKTRNQMKSNF
jgi:hypothetical protein